MKTSYDVNSHLELGEISVSVRSLNLSKRNQVVIVNFDEMITVLLLCVAQLTIAAVPAIRDQEPRIISLDGVEGVMYEIGDYEDQMTEYQSPVMGGSPLLSLLQMVKKQSEDKDKYIAPKEKYALAKQSLDEIVSKLTTISRTLGKGNGYIHYSDIEKSIEGLKKLERSFRPDMGHLLSSMRDTMSISRPIFKSGIRTPVTAQPVEVAVVTEGSAPTEGPVVSEEPIVTEEPVASTVEEVERSTIPPFAMEVYKPEKSVGKKVEDDVKSRYQNRWTWKSSSFV